MIRCNLCATLQCYSCIRAERDIALQALRKIDEPLKHHHWEEDPYTRAGCFQFVAHEARKTIGDTDALAATGKDDK